MNEKMNPQKNKILHLKKNNKQVACQKNARI